MNIKLFVCCHRPFEVPEYPLLVPVQVGTALAAERFVGFCHDDEGENISVKNRSYCELTAQYWAWKNVEADYYGFFHYRRYLYPDAEAKRPYRIEAQPELSWLERRGYSRFAKIIERYDIIAPKGEDMHISVRKHYTAAPYHHGKDLELAAQIVCERHPEMTAAVDDYLNGTVCYFGNIYIMSKSAFNDYCGWLFPILEEFDRRADLSGYNQQELRVDGYLAERLFGMYYTHRRSELRCLELPRVHFEPDRRQRWKMKVVNWLLPAGSWRRAFVKKLGSR